MPRGSMTYQTRTDSDLKSAFLRILEKKPLSDMTIAEVVREAQVSRSTFYLHYQNLGDLYDEMVREVACQVLPLLTGCGCNCEPENGKKPFCHVVRETNRYTPLFRESRFLETILQSEGAAEQSTPFTPIFEQTSTFTPAPSAEYSITELPCSAPSSETDISSEPRDASATTILPASSAERMSPE